MDTTHPRFIQRSTRAELIELLHVIADELQLRAKLSTDKDATRQWLKASMRLVEARAYLRQVDQVDSIPAAPVPATEHGASEESGAPTGDTTTAGAAGVFQSPLQRRARQAGFATSTAEHLEALATGGYSRETWQCARCKEDLGHEGECRPVAGPETAPLLTRPDCAAGAARAEGADREDREAGRPSSSGGRVDLAHHLRVLKSGGVA